MNVPVPRAGGRRCGVGCCYFHITGGCMAGVVGVDGTRRGGWRAVLRRRRVLLYGGRGAEADVSRAGGAWWPLTSTNKRSTTAA